MTQSQRKEQGQDAAQATGLRAYRLVVTASPKQPCLTGTLVDTLTRLIDDAVADRRWLATGIAWELSFVSPADKIDTLRGNLATTLVGYDVDINILPDDNASRRKKLLIADMDSTIIQQECIDEIADFAGAREEVSDVTERAMRGELEFDDALRARVALLKGLPEETLQRVADERLTLMSGAKTLIATMRANGSFCALVSGGFTYFTERIAARAGFDVNQANTLVIEDGKLTGEVREPILGRDAKSSALGRYRRELNLNNALTLAVGDGANDLSMIEAAGLGVAYRAKPIVADLAGVAIDACDLTGLLYLQGYTREEFVDI